MALKTTGMPREFTYNGASLPDPGSHLSVEEVKDIFTANFPELTTATVEGPTVKGDKLVYAFARTAGAKGSEVLEKWIRQQLDGQDDKVKTGVVTAPLAPFDREEHAICAKAMQLVMKPGRGSVLQANPQHLPPLF